MQLSQIYSNQKKFFDTIDFNCCDNSDVLNVIYGAITDSSDTSKDSHNLGKTTLVNLIDFLLLQSITGKSHFLEVHQDRFKDFIFFIELALGNGAFVTIRRSVDSNTKISIHKHEERGQNLEKKPLDEWDHSDLDLEPARELLDGLLDLRVLGHYDYRKAINYFLRTQDDYLDVLQLKKFSIGRDLYWKPFILTLLGFNEKKLIKKYGLDKEIEDLGQQKKKKEQELQIEENDLLRLSAEIQNLKVQLKETESSLDRFEFTHEERRLMHELVDNIEVKISEYNDELYNIRTDIRNIEASISKKMAFKIDDIQDVYEECKIHFPEQLKNSYEELVGFNKKLTQERNRALKKRRTELTELQEQIRQERVVEDKKRHQYSSILHGSDSLEKYKALQNNLSIQKADLTYLEGQFERLKSIQKLESEYNDKVREKSKTIDEIKDLIAKDSAYRTNLAANFSNYCKRVLDHDALFYINVNKNGNVEFPVQLKAKGHTGSISMQSEGKSYKQLLCALFDLALLKTYESAQFFRFVYHDGIFEGLDDRKKKVFLEIVKEVIGGGNIQYILSVIDSDVPRDSEGQRIEFSEDEIVLRLDDSGDAGRLFKMPAW